MIDLILHEYPNSDYVLGLPMSELYPLLESGAKRRERDRQWRLWSIMFPHFTADTYMSFEEFIDPGYENGVYIDQLGI